MANVINSLKLGSGTYVFTTPYATCSTDAAAAAKVATITPGSNFSLETGARVAVKFTNANTAGSPTLNVNSTGAKAIYFQNAALTYLNYWSAGQIVEFIYDGTNWVCSAVVTDNDTHWSSSLVSTNSSGGLTNAAADPTSGAGYLYLNLIENSIVRNSHKIEGSGLTKVTSNASGDINISSSLSSYDTSDKIFLIGAKSQVTATSSTWSHDTAYVGTDGCLYSNSHKVATLEDVNDFTGSNSFASNVVIKGSNGITTQGSSALQYTQYNYGTITHTPDATGSAYTLTIPAKTGTLALTSDIPSTSSFVTIANEQTITGKKIFNGGVQFGTNTVFNNNGIQIPAANAFKVMGMYDVSLPSKSGTIALTSDIPSGGGSGDVTAAGNNTFTGNNAFKGGTTSFITASFMTAAGRPSDPVTTVDSDGVHCSIDNSGVGTHYMDNQIQNKAFTLTIPTKNGTLATTSDIPIKSATLSGTTLSITLS